MHLLSILLLSQIWVGSPHFIAEDHPLVETTIQVLKLTERAKKKGFTPFSALIARLYAGQHASRCFPKTLNNDGVWQGRVIACASPSIRNFSAKVTCCKGSVIRHVRAAQGCTVIDFPGVIKSRYCATMKTTLGQGFIVTGLLIRQAGQGASQ